ncbi:dCMP deaminase [Salmonella phage SE4]|uniref:dCMP deaminase n=1 Tax=Salmonella phage SE4 TaxID=2575328 RepID=UPI0011D2E56A|nr:dCMP deaminase [Salmonella phage SE4]QEG07744.1 dCMP deaminase [Salmonella phage SE4]
MDKWDKRFLRVAREISTWSKDPKRSVGCVIVDAKKRIISTGYNGLPEQLDALKEVPNDLKNALTIHAEVNALANIRKELDASTLGPVTVYITYPPCEHCAKMLTANLNVKRVVAFVHKAKQTKWKDSMANAVSHLVVGEGVIYDEFEPGDITGE